MSCCIYFRSSFIRKAGVLARLVALPAYHTAFILLAVWGRTSAQAFYEFRLATSANLVHLSRQVNVDLAPRVNPLGLAGISAGYWWPSRWGMECGMQYAVKGYDDRTYKWAVQAGNVKGAGFRFRQFEYTARALWRWNEISLFAGGYGGHVLRRQYRDPDVTEWQPLASTFKGFFRNFEAGVLGGLALTYRYGTFFYQYQHGLSAIANFYYTEDGVKQNVRMLNRTFILGVGLHLNGK